MDQLINLYQPATGRRPTTLAAPTLAAIVGVAALFLLAVYVHASLSIGALERTSAELNRTFHRLAERIDAESSVPSLGAAIDADILELQARVDDGNSLLSEIEGLFVDASPGFADVFEILAETPLSGLWLTGVSLDESGLVEISGRTLDPTLVPRYQRLLSGRPPLEHLRRASVSVVREDAGSSDVGFVLSYVPSGGV